VTSRHETSARAERYGSRNHPLKNLVCRLFTRWATEKPSSITLVWPTPPPTVIKVSDGTRFATTRQLTIGMRHRGSFACPQQANDAAHRACASMVLCKGLYANGLAVPLRLWYGVPLMGSHPINPTQYNEYCARHVL
jgi:hypothetical protein